ncbi:hypothetical protein C6500_08480 [Candidatus Poribacteria bacterium]|nr:MAG: hypothetical protein C6500_08480 [Candidatus Poribacteria bacterium]
MLIPLAIFVFVFTSCTNVLYQEMQQERKGTIENYEDARMKFDPEEMKSEIKAQLAGKWQFIGIEIENETVNAQTATPTSENGETGQSSDVSAQTVVPELPQLDLEVQASEAERVQLSPITVEEREDNQKIAAAKMALASANRKNLTLEFYEERTSLYYRGSNRGRKVTGQCNVMAPRVGDVPLPLIRFRQRTGPKMLEFLFTSEPARLMTARSKQAYAENMQRTKGKNFVNTNQPVWWDKHENVRRLGGRGSEKASPKGVSYVPASALGIEVTDNRLYIILEGDMELTPKGWIRTGGMRCAFKRIE